jgi:carbon monoxide dehydrogenase subunit G
MATFSHRTTSTAVVPAPRSAIWDLLSDPATLAAITPLVTGIDAHGDRWTWHLAGISALGICIAPTFTEAMTLEPMSHIGFHHEPPAGEDERAAVEGTYDLRDVADGTELSIDLTLSIEAPLPKLARGAVEKVIAASMARTGDRFAKNLYERLGLDPADASVPVTA